MRRILIALRGPANSGKSTIIKKLYNLLPSRYKNNKAEYGIFRVDIRVILTINNIKIGIESQGDPNSRLTESLELFAKEKCKVIICATRTRGQTVDAVEKWARQYKIISIEQAKSLPSKQKASNDLMARKLLRAVEEAIRH